MVELCRTIATLLAFIAAITAAIAEVPEMFNSLHKPSKSLSSGKAKYHILWFEQKLDHFNPSESRTWPMRFLMNNEFFEAGGPLFIIVGGEWDITPGLVVNGHFYDMAREHNGCLLYIEHRYYGESRPVEAMTNENMIYLDIHEVLADLAHFIRTIKTNSSSMKNSKVILLGASYAGSVVTWFKKLYPDLAVGGWASSAPLKAIVDFSEFKVNIDQAIMRIGGYACHNRIKSGFRELESLIDRKQGAKAKSILKACNSFNEKNNLDVSVLFYKITEVFGYLIQNHTVFEIQTACNRIMQGPSDIIGVANYLLDNFNNKGCNDFSYSSYINIYKNVSFSDNLLRPWLYQTCNQLGWFLTTSSPRQHFSKKCPLSFFTTLCADAFGAKFTQDYIEQRVRETNRIFGGLTPHVNNIYWTHGQWDPWRSVGIQADPKQSTILPYLTHAKDLNSISVGRDSIQLLDAKKKIANLVRKWLA